MKDLADRRGDVSPRLPLGVWAIVAVCSLSSIVALLSVILRRTSTERSVRPDASNMGRPQDARTPQVIYASPLDRWRLERLERDVAALTGSHKSEEPRPAQAHGPAERAQRIREELNEHQQLLANHAAEQRDDSWATPTERSIATRMQKRSAPGLFEYKSVDCRTNTCVVTLRWPSWGKATADLLHASAALSTPLCSSQLALPPDQTEGEVTGTAVLNCSRRQ